MKSMLYVGASLMIGASIYGFVDYKQNHSKKGFTEMYREVSHETVKPVVAVQEEKKEIAKTETVVPTVAKKTAKTRKAVIAEEEPVISPVPVEESIETDVVVIEEGDVELEPKPEASVKKTKKKRLNHKIFSRAPLRDEVEVEKVPVKETKPVSKEKS
jgi:hypothetical protein